MSPKWQPVCPSIWHGPLVFLEFPWWCSFSCGAGSSSAEAGPASFGSPFLAPPDQTGNGLQECFEALGSRAKQKGNF